MKTLKELGVSPAPWEQGENDNGQLMIYNSDNLEIAQSFMTSDDARLIAAAPELYEALREIVADNKCGLMCSLCGAADKCKIRRAVAALEKAGGAE